MAQDQDVGARPVSPSGGGLAHRLALWSWWASVAWTQSLAMFPGWLFAERARTLLGTSDDFEGPPSPWAHLLSIALLWAPAVLVYWTLDPRRRSFRRVVPWWPQGGGTPARMLRTHVSVLIGGTVGLHVAFFGELCAGLRGPDMLALEALFLGVVVGLLLRDRERLGCASLLMAPAWALSIVWWVWPACTVWNYVDPQGWCALLGRLFG